MEIKLEDGAIRRHDVVVKHLTKHIGKYLADVVWQFLPTRDYSLITKPRYKIWSKELQSPFAVSFNKENLMAVGYWGGQVAIWDISSQELICSKDYFYWRGFRDKNRNKCVCLVSFNNLWLFSMRASIYVLNSKLEKIGAVEIDSFPNFQGMATCERQGWIALSERRSGSIKFFDLKQITNNVLEPKAVTVKTITGLKYPAGLCFNDEGTVLAVAEDRTISLFNPLKGEKLLSFGNEHLGHPKDVKLDMDGNFVVCNRGHRKLCIFDQTGTFLLSLLNHTPRLYTLYTAAIDSTGTIAVSTSDKDSVYVL